MTEPALLDGRWEDVLLDALPVRRGFRLRGTTRRLDTFVDAAFAFAVTLLAIAVDDLPDSYQAFLEALTHAPAFITCFAMLMMFWWGHHVWSQRYGLDDVLTTLVSLFLVAVVLVYVFPLRVIFEAFYASFSRGALSATFALTMDQLGIMFVVFGIGFTLMSGALAVLYLHAYSRRELLRLDPLERFDTAADTITWLLVAATGLASTIVALVLPDRLSPAAGFVYWLLIVIMPGFAYLSEKRRRRLADAEQTSDQLLQ